MTDKIKLVILSGAGISVPSGIRPYRGKGGLWTENPELEAKSTSTYYGKRPELLWEQWGPLRDSFIKAQPNKAHLAIKGAEAYADVTVVTQNIDNLHERAGSRKVLDIHGNLFRTRCLNPKCKNSWYDESAEMSRCKQCNSRSRPDVVLFGENVRYLDDMQLAAGSCDAFIAVGTSGEVWPASDLVSAVPKSSPKVLINIDPWRHPHPDFDNVINDDIITTLPSVLEGILGRQV